MRPIFFYLLPFSFLAGSYLAMFFLFPVPQVATPMLIGKTVHESALLVGVNQLTFAVVEIVPKKNSAPGIVIQQTPSPASLIRVHQPVYVWITEEQPVIDRMPLLVGNTAEEIEAICGVTPIPYKIFEVPVTTSDYATNRCIAQSLDEGTLLSACSELFFYFPKSSASRVLWPNFLGHRFIDVLDFLTAYDIVPQLSGGDGAYSIGEQRVLHQYPAPGTAVEVAKIKKGIVQLEIGFP